MSQLKTIEYNSCCVHTVCLPWAIHDAGKYFELHREDAHLFLLSIPRNGVTSRDSINPLRFQHRKENSILANVNRKDTMIQKRFSFVQVIPVSCSVFPNVYPFPHARDRVPKSLCRLLAAWFPFQTSLPVECNTFMISRKRDILQEYIGAPYSHQ